MFQLISITVFDIIIYSSQFKYKKREHRASQTSVNPAKVKKINSQVLISNLISPPLNNTHWNIVAALSNQEYRCLMISVIIIIFIRTASK